MTPQANPWLGFLPLIFIGLVIALPWYRIFKRAGFNPWLCLTMFIPPLNLFMIWWFAFMKWPVEATPPK